MIPFNKPFLTGKELEYIKDAITQGKISGNGYYTKQCQEFFQRKYGFKKCLLTTSCTDALEMASILCDIKPGDEVIVPSFTFVSTALAFVRQGAKIIFAESCINHPNIDTELIESLITPRTKAIVPVHYAGTACNMDKIGYLSKKYNLYVIEDAAQAINSFHNGNPLGRIGHLAAFSFHETKNIISGEGGMLAINDERFIRRAEIIWEKGTNRAEFFRNEVNKYGWVDIGSSFLPSEIIAAFLWAQIESMEDIQNKRKKIWESYYEGLKPLADKGLFQLPVIPEYATNNFHLFYLVCNSLDERSTLITYLKENEILSVFHYLSLHKSVFYSKKHDFRELPNCDRFADCLVRLPMFYELDIANVNIVVSAIHRFYKYSMF